MYGINKVHKILKKLCFKRKPGKGPLNPAIVLEDEKRNIFTKNSCAQNKFTSGLSDDPDIYG